MASSTKQSALDQKRVDRLQILIDKGRKFNQLGAEDRDFYEKVYKREEDWSSNRKRKRNSVNVGTNEQISNFKHSFSTTYKSPEPKTQLDRMASYIVDTLYPNEKALFRSTSENLYSREKAYVIEKLLNKQTRDVDFRDTLLRTVKAGLNKGTVILQTRWVYETEEINDIDEMAYLKSLLTKAGSNTKLAQQIQQELDPIVQNYIQKKQMQQPTVIFDGPEFDIIDPNNFYVDPASSKLRRQAEFIVIEKFTHLLRLKYLADTVGADGKSRLNKANVELIGTKASGGSASRPYTGSPVTTMDAVDMGAADVSDVNPIIKYYEIWEKGRVSIVTKDEGLLLDYRRKLFKEIDYPFVVFSTNPNANEFYGQSIYSGCDSLIEFSDEMQMMIFEQYRRHIEGRTFVQGKNINDDNLLKRLARGESGLYKVKDINGIKEDRPETPSGDTWALMDRMQMQMRGSFGADNLIGQSSMGSNARTDGIVDNITSKNESFINSIIVMYAAGLRQIGRLMLKLNREFLTKPETFAYTYGAEAVFDQTAPLFSIVGTAIPTDFEIDMNLKATADNIEAQEKKEMSEIITMATNMQYPFFRVDRAFVELLSKCRGFSSPTALIDPNYMMLLQQDQAMAQTAGAPVSPGMFGPMSTQKAQMQGQGQPPPQQQGPGSGTSALTGPGQNQSDPGLRPQISTKESAFA